MNTILISLAISALITLASVGLEYAIVKKGGIVPLESAANLHLGEMVIPDPQIDRLKYVNLSAYRRCSYCKTTQGVGARCLNCGAPLS